MRGSMSPRRYGDLVEEAKRLATAGRRELLLIAQDSTYTVWNLYGKRRLRNLLRAFPTSRHRWIRLHFAFPAGFPMDVLDVMRERPNICKYLDMPLQHITDKMADLDAARNHEAKTEELVAMIREKVPGIGAAHDLDRGISRRDEGRSRGSGRVGVKKARFDRLGVFNTRTRRTRTLLLATMSRKEKKRARGRHGRRSSRSPWRSNSARVGRS